MSTSFDTRKSWQIATKFREHLTSINTKSTAANKSAWSPITPHPTDYEHFEPSSPPPPMPLMPPMPAVHAVHTRTQTQDIDEKRSIETARAEAAAALERGSKERQEERERADRERQRRLLQEHERAYEAMRAKRTEAGMDDDRTSVDDGDMERGRAGEEYAFLNAPPPSSLAARSKAALSRVSQAFFRFTNSAAPQDASPYPRDTLPSHRDSVPRQSRFGLKFPARLSDLSPWPALNVNEKSQYGSDAGAVHHHHYYGEGGQSESRGHSRATSFVDEPEHTHRDASGSEKGHGEHGKHKRCQGCRADNKKRKRGGKCWCILLLILILLLLGSVVFLSVRVINTSNTPTQTNTIVINGTSTVTFAGPSSTSVASTTTQTTGTGTSTSTTTASASATTTSSVDPAVASCLSSFSSMTSPTTYPCSECVPILAAIPNDFSLPLTTTPATTGQGSVLQFCALQAINNLLPTADAGALTNAGWFRDNSPCTWAGASCDKDGRLKTLELITPGVPTTLPDDMQFLVGLQTLAITGDNNLPSGSINPILTLSTLKTLNLLQTGLSASFDDQTTFGALASLSSLSLNKNSKITIGGSTMGGITELPLNALLINGQTIPDSVLSILPSTTAGSRMTSLNLSNTGQTGAVPGSLASGLPNLLEIVLDGNSFTSLPDPTTNNGVIFPSTVQVVSIRANTGMAGTVASGECAALQSATVSRCDFTGTGIVLADGVNCGICQFGTTASS